MNYKLINFNTSCSCFNHSSKAIITLKAAQDAYEGDYQEIIPLRKRAIDMNFRIVERI